MSWGQGMCSLKQGRQSRQENGREVLDIIPQTSDSAYGNPIQMQIYAFFISNFIKPRKEKYVKSLRLFTNQYSMCPVFLFIAFSSQSLLKFLNPLLAVLIKSLTSVMKLPNEVVRTSAGNGGKCQSRQKRDVMLNSNCFKTNLIINHTKNSYT